MKNALISGHQLLLIILLKLPSNPAAAKKPIQTVLTNPNVPQEIHDFKPMMGRAECLSTRRLSKDEWGQPVQMSWTFSYIMDGMAIFDETIKADGVHSGSFRQYDTENQTWRVHYFSTSNPVPEQLPAWSGGKQGSNLVFKREQTAPNGMLGFYRLTFFDINEQGYEWIGEWVDPTETIIYPTWKISCKKNIQSKSRL